MNRIPSHIDEPYYDIPLINDIHTHFPELLYNIDRFQSVRDVLQYVRSRVQARYDLFSTASDNYNYSTQNIIRGGSGSGSGGASARRLAATPVQQVAATAATTAATAATTAATAATAAAATIQQPRRTAPITASINDIYTTPIYTTRFDLNNTLFPIMQPAPQEMEMDNATALLTLLGIMAQPTAATAFEPVTVRPSHTVINNATRMETVTVARNPDELCVICQDIFDVSARIRHITQCGHTFHDDCILQHFENSVRCPTCRYDIRDTSPSNP